MYSGYKKVLDITNIELVSINDKFINRYFATSKEYKQLKKTISTYCNRSKFYAGKVAVLMGIFTNKDQDNVLKPIYDGLESIIENDKNVHESHVYKYPIKKGSPERLIIYIKEIDCEDVLLLFKN